MANILQKTQNGYHSTLGHSLVGAVAMWAALPPLDWWPLAWIAPLWWVLLARRETLPGRRPYLAVWLGGFVFWMAALHWLRFPHPASSLGWIALSFYLAFYVLLFVGLTRVGVHRLGLSVVLVAPVVWTGLELARGHVLGGFTMASLAHTQYRQLEVIQISDLVGAYGLGFGVMLVAACIARIVPAGGRRWTLWPIVPGALLIAGVLGYGYFRLSGQHTEPGARIALVQGSIPAQLKADASNTKRIHDEYEGLSARAVKEHPDVDLIVWPETMFRYPLVEIGENPMVPEEFRGREAEYLSEARRAGSKNFGRMAELAGTWDTALLLGVDTCRLTSKGERLYNSAVFVTREGELLGRYDKNHLVMFGEYVPLAEHFPWLYRLTPLARGMTPGEGFVAFPLTVEGPPTRTFYIAPNICYETVVPRVIRRQVNQLASENREPAVLVNLTNDGWFRGSSELDMHLACGVFRAVECRKPLLIAANTGFSAWIDGDGRILDQGRRYATDTIVADVRLDSRQSWYLAHGDWLAGVCLGCCLLLAGVGCWGRRSGSRKAAPPSPRAGADAET